ncbi:hypothetical protein KDRO_D04120 [Kluyveromyces lactis]|nr:hypothetical protein KDRO_D04120 [Kluyveromyces lactis]
MKVILENKRYQKEAGFQEPNSDQVNKGRGRKSNSGLPNNKGTNPLVLIMQDYKDGQVTRNPDNVKIGQISVMKQTDFGATSAGQKVASTDSHTTEAARKTLDYTGPAASLVKDNLKRTSSVSDERCQLSFKNCNIPASTPETKCKKQRSTDITNKKKLHKTFRYVNVETELRNRDQGKPTFKIKKPPTLEQKSVKQASLMGLFSSKIGKHL